MKILLGYDDLINCLNKDYRVTLMYKQDSLKPVISRDDPALIKLAEYGDASVFNKPRDMVRVVEIPDSASCLSVRLIRGLGEVAFYVDNGKACALPFTEGGEKVLQRTLLNNLCCVDEVFDIIVRCKTTFE